MGNIAASVLAKLKNKARQQGIPLQQLINLFCQEEFIRRLSKSIYKASFAALSLRSTSVSGPMNIPLMLKT